MALITDGSANWKDRSGGWAWIALDAFEGIDKASGYYGNTTNNQMELTAPTEGLSHLMNRYGPCEVLIYCDSLYVITTRKREKNKTFWRRLDEAVRQHKSVEWTHVRGHNGHFWNEMADQMAGEARRKGEK